MTDHRTARIIGLVGAVASAAALAAAGGAHAATSIPDQTYTPALQLFPRETLIAESFWPGSPCAGREQIAVVPQAMGTDEFSGQDVRVWGMALNSDPFCRVVIDSITPDDRVMLCYVLAHEFGHLAGRNHSTDPDDLMFPALLKPPPQCAADAPTPVVTVPAEQKPAPKAKPAKKHKAKHKKRKHRRAHKRNGR